MHSKTHENADISLQLLKVYLGRHCFGIDILTIEDVITRLPKTPVPLAHPCVLGLLNLRGHVVTEVNVAYLLDITHEQGEGGEYALIINHEGARYSMVFDKVADVFTTSAKQIEPLPETIDGDWHSFTHGVCRTAEELIVLLDLKAMIDLISQRLMLVQANPV